MSSLARPSARPWTKPVRMVFLLVAIAIASLLWLQSGGWAALADRDESDGPLVVNADHPLPAGTEEITGISYEPWRFRYVGREIAEQCHDNEWTLEEYVAAL